MSNVRAKALEATVSESGRQLQTPKVSVEFPLLAVYYINCYNDIVSIPPRGFVHTFN